MSPPTKNTAKLHDPEWLRREYVEKGRTAADIAAELGVTKEYVWYRASAMGIKANRTYQGECRRAIRRRSPVRDDRLYDVEWLREEYLIKKRSGSDIAKELGCCRESVFSALRQAGLKKYTSHNKVTLRVRDPELAKLLRLEGCS